MPSRTAPSNLFKFMNVAASVSELVALMRAAKFDETRVLLRDLRERSLLAPTLSTRTVRRASGARLAAPCTQQQKTRRC
jgi:hypothetical protein